MADMIGQICQLLPTSNGNIKPIAKQCKKSEKSLLQIILALFIEAVGMVNFHLFAKRDQFPLLKTLHSTFQREVHVIQMVINIASAKQNPLQSSDLIGLIHSQGFLTFGTKDQWLTYWTEKAIHVMPYPHYSARLNGFHSEVLKVTKRYEEKEQEMVSFLYGQLSDQAQEVEYSSFPLLSLYKSVALMSREGPVTWGSLVHAYHDHIPDENRRGERLLAHYPFPGVVQQLHTPCPIPCRAGPQPQSFQEFTINMTLDGMALTFGHTLPPSLSITLSQKFMGDDLFRRNLSFFASDPKQKLKDGEGKPLYPDDQMPFFFDCRMYFNFVEFHIPPEKGDRTEGRLHLPGHSRVTAKR